ncbi:MAG: hypothetical protein ABS92_06090 [Thiobacillus sp. SCN 63-374]|nr:MAG: hypothetical protein ABS92_06090 [Thiobacillus sp. SCN 63-374]
MRAGEAEEGRVAPVHHVVGQRVRGDDARRQRRQLAGEAGGGGVDDEVEGSVDAIEAAGGDTAAEQSGEFLCPADGAVGNDERGGRLLQQGFDHAARRAAGTEQQDALAGERAMQVAGEIGHQSGAVGVVAENAAGIERQRVHRAGALGPRAEAVCQGKCLFLERYRDVGAAPARRYELRYAVGKAVLRREDRLVRHVLPGLTGKRGVDQRGFGMGNRVPEYGVTVGHGGRILTVDARIASCRGWPC